MGQVLHGSATTTPATRRAIQHSQASLSALAAENRELRRELAEARMERDILKNRPHGAPRPL
ncbi:hypothetical protein ACUHMQ_09365 [Chitinimonas sp. PSY-7]|uniref:hypothetical protein n=1 Tax=Chitinimonas sp. PSY-7 TaxID=3459088 RepID=UPI00403FCCA4